MTKPRGRGEVIRRFILRTVESHPTDLAAVTAARFGISRQAVNAHLRRLVAEGALLWSGRTRARSYRLAPLEEWQREYDLADGLEEDQVWSRDLRAAMGELSENALAIWHYGFTEMFNNVLDHSEGSRVVVQVRRTAMTTEMVIADDGLGIFRKIQAALNLLDERHAVLELAKGKLTTDPSRHTGEGIFFTSRMFDEFDIMSGGVHFSHAFDDPRDWILQQPESMDGTWVWMKLDHHTSRTTTKVFDTYSTGDDYGFTKTVVPVRLAQYGDEALISRSQAKRLLTRVELFRTVIFDFSDVKTIGQAFADEIFRVFARHHPDIELYAVKMNSGVRRMIERAQRG